MAYAVLTRDAAEIAAYAAALAPLGLEVIATPVTRTAPAADPAALRRALIAEHYDAVIVTSRRGAEALIEAARACGTQLPAVWVVGEATRRVLGEAGIAAAHPAGVRDGRELAHAVVAARGVRRVLYPRAEDGRAEPIAVLRAAGVIVDDVVAYRTLARAVGDPAVARGVAALVGGGAAVCAVFAPSQVVALAALVDPRAVSTGWIAIGETTAAALRAAGVAAVAVAEAPTPEGIAKAAASVYRSAP